MFEMHGSQCQDWHTMRMQLQAESESQFGNALVIGGFKNRCDQCSY